jgi:hypothetical protein
VTRGESIGVREEEEEEEEGANGLRATFQN